jgi:preprotein translocase subunit SecF
MMQLISRASKFDFVGKGKIFFPLSALAVALALYIFISGGEAKYGTDFSGGHEFLVTFNGGQDSEQIRKGLDGQGINDARVQAFQGQSKEYSIRLGDTQDAQQVRAKIETALKGAFGDTFVIQKTDYVGPTVGNELRRSALLAVVVGLIGILLYIAIRFEFAVALGSIIALFHDVIITTGVYLASGHLISMATLAAALTIVGYSVNDTVVVFDRVREERAKRPGAPLADVVNEALNFTLSRTVITHVLTFFSALALYLLGGGEIADLSLYLVSGIVCGAYSTIFVVAPFVVFWERFRGRDVARK